MLHSPLCGSASIFALIAGTACLKVLVGSVRALASSAHLLGLGAFCSWRRPCSQCPVRLWQVSVAVGACSCRRLGVILIVLVGLETAQGPHREEDGKDFEELEQAVSIHRMEAGVV